MRRSWLLVALIAVVAVVGTGVGGCSHTAGDESSDAAGAVAGREEQAWTSIETLISGGLWSSGSVLVSKPFHVRGAVRLVLRMAGGEDLDCVVGAVIPAESALDPDAVLRTIPSGTPVVVMPESPVQDIQWLDGTYVLVNTVPIDKAWSLEICAQSQ